MQDHIKHYGWQVVFNAPYSSEIHCIENVFALIKRHYKVSILQQDPHVPAGLHKQLIQASINSVTKEQVVNTIAKYKRVWDMIARSEEDYEKRPPELGLEVIERRLNAEEKSPPKKTSE